MHTVQVSSKITVEQYDDEHETLFNNVVMSSVKFIAKWFRQGLIKGVINNNTDQAIEDFISHNEWITDFRVVGKKKKYAQMHFKVKSIVP